MTGPRINLRLLSVVLGVGVLGSAAGCASFYEIPIETPIAAKLDVSAFQRVFIAGFLRAAPTTWTATWKRCACCAASCG